MIGIYKITNLINGKSYIGQSVDIYKRWKREKEDSNNINSCSYEYPLMRAFRKYGFDNFYFEIIEECKIEELNEKEMYWINFYDTFFNGYNQTLGGDTTSRQPKEKIIGIISDLKNTDMVHKDIALKWDISMEMVQGINTGRYWKHNADYPLQKRKTAKNYYCKKCGKEITKGATLCKKCYSELKSYNMLNGIEQINKAKNTNIPDKEMLFKQLCDNNGNFTAIAKLYGVSDTTIRKWCTKYDIPNHSSDYRTRKVKEKIRSFKINVIQLDKNTEEEINRFESIIEATKNLGLNNDCGSHISAVCNGKRKTAYGYKWKYLNDNYE